MLCPTDTVSEIALLLPYCFLNGAAVSETRYWIQTLTGGFIRKTSWPVVQWIFWTLGITDPREKHKWTAVLKKQIWIKYTAEKYLLALVVIKPYLMCILYVQVLA